VELIFWRSGFSFSRMNRIHPDASQVYASDTTMMFFLWHFNLVSPLKGIDLLGTIRTYRVWAVE
jgi:hypothetical protein